jgi:mono/diheme cytochrome c family protein
MRKEKRMPSPLRLRSLVLTALLCGAGTPAYPQSGDQRFASPTRFLSQSGELLYADICQGCHMANGEGATGAGTYPSLVRDPNLASAGYLVSLVIKGHKDMPPFGSQLSDQQVAAVVNFVRTHFGNDYRDEATADDARAARR